MIDHEFEAKCLAQFMKNPFYREEYENAPSEACRRYLRMLFCHSKAPDEKVYMLYVDECTKAKAKLRKEDLEHLIQYCGNNRARYEYRKQIERLEQCICEKDQ